MKTQKIMRIITSGLMCLAVTMATQINSFASTTFSGLNNTALSTSTVSIFDDPDLDALMLSGKWQVHGGDPIFQLDDGTIIFLW